MSNNYIIPAACPAVLLCFLMLLLAIAAIGPLGAARGEDIHVTKQGSMAPDGSLAAPFSTIEAALFLAGDDPATEDTVIVGPGQYRERFTSSTAAKITGAEGTARIGDLNASASTTLRIISLNTHLNLGWGENWQDSERRDDIGFFLKNNIQPPADVVGMQEVWSWKAIPGSETGYCSLQRPYEVAPSCSTGEDCPQNLCVMRDLGAMSCAITGGGCSTDSDCPPNSCFGTFVGLVDRADYSYWAYGPTAIIGKDSGLALMSKFEMIDIGRNEFDASCGLDSLSAKGWMIATIHKDGFGIGIVTTHTDADNDWCDSNARYYQLIEIRDSINTYRIAHPSYPVFLFGDFNIYGEDTYKQKKNPPPWNICTQNSNEGCATDDQCSQNVCITGDFGIKTCSLSRDPCSNNSSCPLNTCNLNLPLDEYQENMVPILGDIGGHDAQRNVPGFSLSDKTKTYTYSTKNKLASYFDDEMEEGRLDYIVYFSSLDGSVEVVPKEVHPLPFKGRSLTEDGLTTDDSSDHYAIDGTFAIYRN